MSRAQRTALLGAALAIATATVYWNSRSVPFLFDDHTAIVANPSIRRLSWTALVPPHEFGETVAGRPILNLSFALNYAASGTREWSYHVGNILIHIAAGLTLFGLLRRMLAGPPSHPPLGRPTGVISSNSELIALTAAAAWLLHPLQTEAVTYVAQRAESLVSLFYLLTLYAVVRAANADVAAGESAPVNEPCSGEYEKKPSRRMRRVWHLIAVGSCAMGMATKEVMVTAPIVALLLDRSFIAGTFRDAWRSRSQLYLLLASTWLVLAVLVFANGSRAGTAGWTALVTPWTYGLTQCDGLLHYVARIVWPNALVFDYGTAVVRNATEVAPQIVIVALFVIGTCWALSRWPRIGFAAAAFVLVLAPSSSVIPVITQTVAEHRVYLGSAVFATLGVMFSAALTGRRGFLAVLGAAIAFGALTIHRNNEYHSGLRLWSTVTARWPSNSRAHNNLAVELIAAGRFDAATREATAAVTLAPNFAEAHNNLSTALSALGRKAEAVAHLRTAIELRPDYAEAYNNLGHEWMNDQVTAGDAIACFEHALALRPDFGDAENNLGLVFTKTGRAREAIAHLERSVKLQPTSHEAFNNLGIALATAGRGTDALAAFSRAAELAPHNAKIHENWGKALLLLGRQNDAAAQFAIATQLTSK
jgi:protein O-mannosyl-transferase